MKDKTLLIAFVAASLFAAGWAFYLIGVHYDAIYEVEGAACGPEGGCLKVLQSDDAEIFGVPVSVPAVPMFLLLAVLGIGVLLERFDRSRLAELGTLCGLGGLAFGGWLFFKMQFFLDSLCKFCLTMDASNLAVLGLALFLHPSGPKAALKGIGGVFARMKLPGPEMALIPVVLLGTAAVQVATVRHAPPEQDVVVQIETPAPTPAATPSTSTEAPTPRPAPTGAPKPGTRRLVLSDERAEIATDASVPFRGEAGTPVEIILFEDFQCPYCKKLSGNLEVLLEDPEIASKVRVGFMHFPMHQNCNANELSKSLHKFACSSAAASICADKQGKFWEMHDLMFRNNGRLRGSNLKSYAREVGLDMDPWLTCVNAPATQEKILADTRVAGAAGVTGTPALFVNGRKMVGAQPVESIRAAIQVELDGTPGRVLMDVELDGEVTGDLTGAATSVTLDGPDGTFTIDAFEASIDRGKAVSRPGVEPARSVTWYDAQAACEAAGKRLCSEEEWMYACTGAVQIDEDKDGTYSRDVLQGRQHSYGEHYREGWCADARKANDGLELITGNHPRCVTPEGVYDLEGVTKEWIGLTPDKAVLKGGSLKSRDSARCAYYKDSEAPDTRDDTIGFRCCSGGSPDEAAASTEFVGGKVGDPIREFAGDKLGGGTLGSADLQGSPFILTFWASWCEPCKKELPALAAAYEANKGRGLKVIAVNVDADPARRDAYLSEHPLPFPVLDDSSKTIMNSFQSRGGGIPLTFWVERSGFIRQRTTGYDDAAHAKFLENVDELLAK